MKRRRYLPVTAIRQGLALLLFALLAVAAGAARAASVLMISVDGLKPEYVLDADARIEASLPA